MSYKKYINSALQRRFTLSGIEVFVKDPLPPSIDAKKVLKHVLHLVPRHLMNNVDIIYIGQFQKFLDSNINASYKMGAIYVTNEQDDFKDMVDDIVHEIAHAVEESFGELIYSDGKIREEFNSKREKLFFLLADEGYDVEISDFLQDEYNSRFDNYLLQDIGYPVLSVLASSLFITPYAITSLREYFAVGFEKYFFEKDINNLRKISPFLLEKIQILEYNN